MKKFLTLSLFVSLTCFATEETFLNSLNGTWTLVSSTNRALFLEKESCAKEINLSASLEEGVEVSSTDPEDIYGFEITAEEIKNKAPDPRSEWGRFTGTVKLTDHSIEVIQKLPNVLFGYRETSSIRAKNDKIIIKTTQHALFGHLTSICKYRRN